MSEDSENIVVQEGAPDWVVTFGDLMSLLLCFFVLLLSFSELDKAKYKEVAGSLKKAFGVQYQVKIMSAPKGVSMVAKDFNQPLVPTFERQEFVEMEKKRRAERERVGERLKAEIEESLQEMEAAEGAENFSGHEGIDTPADKKGMAGIKELIGVEVGENEVTIRMMGETAFDSGKADIRDTMLPLLHKIAVVLREQEGEVVVVGHTDNVPIIGGRFKSNLALSMARAASVADFLLNQGHVVPERISTMGFGEYRPIETNDTPEGRQKNRRVEIKLKSPPI